MTEDKKSKKIGVLADEQIAPGEDLKLTLGPFKRGEVPHLRLRRDDVLPTGSLECHTVRLDKDDEYTIVYNFQNYGTKMVRVVIRRVG